MWPNNESGFHQPIAGGETPRLTVCRSPICNWSGATEKSSPMPEVTRRLMTRVDVGIAKQQPVYTRSMRACRRVVAHTLKRAPFLPCCMQHPLATRRGADGGLQRRAPLGRAG